MRVSNVLNPCHADDHQASTPAQRRRLTVSLSIKVLTLAIQIVGLALTGSLTLLANLGDTVTDVAGLSVALLAATLVLRPATLTRTWGLRRLEVLAAAVLAGVRVVLGIYIIVEGIGRLNAPPQMGALELGLLGAFGLVSNLAILAVLMQGRDDSFTMRAAFLDVLNDLLGAAGMVVASLVIAWTGWLRADAVIGMVFGIVIIPRAIKLLRDTGNVLLIATPAGLDLAQLREQMNALPDVLDIHDIHSNLVATGLPTLSAHVIVSPDVFTQERVPDLLKQLQHIAAQADVAVAHTTFQLEPPGLPLPASHALSPSLAATEA